MDSTLPTTYVPTTRVAVNDNAKYEPHVIAQAELQKAVRTLVAAIVDIALENHKAQETRSLVKDHLPALRLSPREVPLEVEINGEDVTLRWPDISEDVADEALSQIAQRERGKHAAWWPDTQHAGFLLQRLDAQEMQDGEVRRALTYNMIVHSLLPMLAAEGGGSVTQGSNHAVFRREAFIRAVDQVMADMCDWLEPLHEELGTPTRLDLALFGLAPQRAAG